MTTNKLAWKYVGDRMFSAIISLDIPMEDLPFVDGRVDVVRFLKLYLKGKYAEDAQKAVWQH